MTLVLAFIGAHLGIFITAVLGVIGTIGGVLHGKASTKAAAADQVKVAQTEKQIAQMDAADARADAEQAKTETVAVKVAAQAQADAATMTDPQLDDAAAKLGILKE